MAEADEEIEALQLKLESEICGLTMEALVEFAQHVKVNTEGLRKIQLSKGSSSENRSKSGEIG